MSIMLLTSCASTPKNVEFKMIEEAIPGVLLPEYPYLVTEANCPEYVGGNLDTIFCTLKVAGKEISVSVVGPDVTDSFIVNPRVKIIKASQLVQKMKERLDYDLGVENRIECSPEIRVSYPGEIFECEIIDANGGVHHLKAKLTDSHGSFEIIS